MSIDPNSADVSDILGASGACPEITVGNKTWSIGWPTQAAKTRLRKLLIGIAEQNMMQAASDLSPGFQKQAQKDFSEAVRNGEYKTWGAGWLAAYNTPRGQLMFLLSLVQENHPSATESDVTAIAREKSDELSRAFLCVAPPFLSLLIDDMEQLQTATAESVSAFKAETIGAMMAQVKKALRQLPTLSTPTDGK